MNYKTTSFYILVYLTFAFSIVKGQEIHDEKIKGIAKSVSISFYVGNITPEKKPKWKSIQYYNNNGKIITYLHFKKYGALEYKDTYVYDNKGNLIEDRSEEGGHLSSKTFYKYDESGGVLESVTLNDDSIPKYKFTYTRNEKGKLIGTAIYDGANNLTTKNIDKIDIRGNIIETKVYNNNNQLVTIWHANFDSRNNIISNVQLGSDNKLISNETHSYTYYPTGGIMNDIYYEKGIINSKQTFDVYGNITESIIYSGNKDNDVVSKEVDEYKIDGKDNWTEKTVYEAGEISSTVIRAIEY